MSTSNATYREELEGVAWEVIANLKGIPDFADARFAIIGGLAVWKYIPRGRTTDDVDFIVNIYDMGATQLIKSKLLALPNTPFVQRADVFRYKVRDGFEVQVDFTGAWQSPYMPSAAMKLREIPHGHVPYASEADIIVFKFWACGMHQSRAKKRIDAQDAENLTAGLTANSPLVLTDT